ncbi:MAG: hypothetical protein NVS3B5_18130 [Sphingomicrobium sp.]
MSFDLLPDTVQRIGPAAAALSFLAGFFFSLNPVAVAAIPVAMAYVTKARERRDSVMFGGMFLAGIIVTHAVLGFLAGLGGEWVEGLLGRQWGLFLGPVLILLGLMWFGLIPIKLPAIPARARRPATAFGAFALAIPFSVAICPICTPALVVLLGAAAASGSPLWGTLLLLAFALGRAVPIAAGAASIAWMENSKVFTAYRKVFDAVAGAAFIGAGAYLLNAYFFWIPALAG